MRHTLLLILVLLFASCKEGKKYVSIRGQTMGTTYNITAFCQEGDQLKKAIDQELAEVNRYVNTYDPNSIISQFNLKNEEYTFEHDRAQDHFYQNIQAAQQVVQASKGLYD